MFRRALPCFAANLPEPLEPGPVTLRLGPPRENPEYRPTPKPWTDRGPGVVYAALAAASLVLLAVAALLARETIRRHDAAARGAPPPAANPSRG